MEENYLLYAKKIISSSHSVKKTCSRILAIGCKTLKVMAYRLAFTDFTDGMFLYLKNRI